MGQAIGGRRRQGVVDRALKFASGRGRVDRATAASTFVAANPRRIPVFRHLLVLALAGAAQLTPLYAQRARSVAPSRDTIDRFVAGEMARQHIPGVSLAVVRAGRMIKAEGYGVADLEHQVPVTPRTAFKIGSLSKQFLATGIMLLAQDGRLTVDDPVATRFPGNDIITHN